MHKHSIYKLIYNAENISGLPVSHDYHRYYDTLKILFNINNNINLILLIIILKSIF